MSKEVKLGMALAGVVVLALAVYVKYRGRPSDGQVEIQPSARNEALTGPGGSAPRTGQPGSLADRSRSSAPQGAAPSPTASGAEGRKDAAASAKDAPAREEVLLAGADDLDNQSSSGPPGEAPAANPTLKDLRLAGSTGDAATGEFPKAAGETSSATPLGGAADANRTAANLPPAGTTNAIAMEYHQVQPGETFARIARMYYGSERHAEFLRSANSDIVADGAALRDGIRIRIPPLSSGQIGPDKPALASNSRGAAPTTKDPANPSRDGTKTTAKPGPATPVKSGAATGQRTYVVKSGETFYTIAKRELGSASRWKELLALNTDLVDGEPKNLRTGHVLKLPNS